jgi:hypothetical protein
MYSLFAAEVVMTATSSALLNLQSTLPVPETRVKEAEVAVAAAKLVIT